MASSKLLRVTQLDAIYLDKELYKALLWVVKDLSVHLPPRFTATYTPEIELFVKFLILYFSIIRKGATFGQKLQAIKYEHIFITKRLLYSMFSCITYLHRFETISRFSHVYKFIMCINTFIKICNLINLSQFLKSGEYPLLLDRILGLNQVYAHNVERSFGSKYLTRELLWNGFIEILVYILPLINYHKLKRLTYRIIPSGNKSKSTFSMNPVFTEDTVCAHCGLSPTLPHYMNCVHIFCYICLKGNQMADPQYTCPKCEHSNPAKCCERLSVL